MSISITVVGLIVAGLATMADHIRQQNEPVVTQVTPATSPDVKDAEQMRVGLRFVVLNELGGNRIFYIPVDDRTVRKHFLRRALPGYRMEFPKDNKLQIFKEPPVAGEAQELLVSADIPENHGDKMLCIIVNSRKGVYPVFVEDGDLQPGMVRIINVTSRNYLLEIPTAPEGEQQKVVMKPDSVHTFGRTLVNTDIPPKTFGVTMKHKVMMKGKETDWLTFRKFMLQSSPTKAFIRLFTEDGSAIMLDDIILFPEKHTEPPVPAS